MRCEVCPVPPDRLCVGGDHPRLCDDVRDGRPGRADQLVRLASPGGSLRPATHDPAIQAAIDADLCPQGAGACGCGAEPRLCGHPDRPALVWRANCLLCCGERAWERVGLII